MVEVVKPAVDKLNYRCLTLDNGIRIILISDAGADKAAAAMDVRVGSLGDPDDLPGLAHFTEHMLFYASEKYPQEDEYSKFVSENGGSTNAYTSSESTNYHFDVNQEHLEGALDRFAQFFISPTISQDGVEREVNAVDSEHGKNLNSDGWKALQLWRHTSNPAHPCHRFSTGNKETLLAHPKAKGIDSHLRMKDFYHAHYSSNIMCLSVYGSHSLDDLEILVKEKFAAVPNSNLPPANIPRDIVTQAETSKVMKVVPERDGHRVELQWAVPPESKAYKVFPCSYLSHLLGHEGEGSVFALLKKLGWATSLSAGESGNSLSSRSIFMVHIELTDTGHDRLQEVVQAVFAYISMLHAPGGVSQARFQENKALSELRFRFADKNSPYNYVEKLSSAMQSYEDRDLLLALHNVPQEYDESAIKGVLAELTPANVRIMWSSKLFQGTTSSTEPWYKTPYSLSDIPQSWQSAWTAASDPRLFLPHPNPFIPSSFDLIQEPQQQQPEVISETPMVKLWHRANTSFEIPKAIVYMMFTCPEAYVTPEAAVLTRLFIKLLEDYFNEVAYPATLAGLHYGMLTHLEGFLLWVSGYNHKLMKLAEAVLREVVDFKVEEDRFQVQKDALQKDYSNIKYEQPYQTAMYNQSLLFEVKRWHVHNYEEALLDLTVEHLQAFMPRLLHRCGVECYVTGNYSRAQSQQLGQHVEQLLKDELHAKPLFPSQHGEGRIVKLQPGMSALFTQPGPNPSNDNSSIVLTYQVGLDQEHSNALVDLLVHCAKRDVFHVLRTQEQLGYLVFLSSWINLSVHSVAFILQSTAFTCQHLERRCEAFLQQYQASLADMTQDSFKAQAEELAKSKLEKVKTLQQQAHRDWQEIKHGSLKFQRRQQEADAIRSLHKSDLVAFFKDIMLSRDKRCKVAVHVTGANEAKPEQEADAAVTTPPEDTVVAQTADAGRDLHDKQPELTATEDNGDGDMQHVVHEDVQLIEDVWAFKRAQMLYPAVK
ncbi:hypothetical protein WJX77_001203 [Trebouxia sp. C0004]